MALNATQQWWVRTDGAEINGGGFDAAVSGAGTNYSDQASPQLALTDLTSTASTTITSATGGFTAAMIGNVLRLASGTGSPTVGYYMLTAVTNSNTATLDRASGTYTAGVAKLGGAHAGLVNYSNGGGLPSPAIATPLLAGNTVNVRGSGSNDPSTVDYDYSAGYWTFPSGDTTSGRITFTGYNGRPMIGYSGLLFYNLDYQKLQNVVFKQTNGSYGQGVCNSATSYMDNCSIDQNGYDSTLWRGSITNSCLKNTGGTSAGAAYVLSTVSYGAILAGNVIKNIRGGGIQDTNGASVIINNLIYNCKGTTASIALNLNFGCTIIGNTIDAGAGDGIVCQNSTAIERSIIRNNIISNNTGSGKYGINCSTGTAAQNNSSIAGAWDYNNLYNNTAARNNHSAGAHDLALDPQYTNAGAGDYSVGTNMKAVGFPSVFPG